MKWIKDRLSAMLEILLVATIGLPLGFLILSLAYVTPLGPYLEGFIAYLSNFAAMVLAMGLMFFVAVVGVVGFALANAITAYVNLLIKRNHHNA